ncbi:MAG: helix-turn-helix transcriptional regulator [Candidatus Limnocylindrales bacterium]
MPGVSRAYSRIQREGTQRALDLRHRVAGDIRRAREDAGLSQRALARAAGVSASTLQALERGRYDPTTEVLARVGLTLGMDLSVRLYPGTGPLIRDRHQAAMGEALLGILEPRWHPSPEVWVRRPVSGVIDLLLEPSDPSEPLVATEVQSELRRLEQQIRWAHAKSDALAEARHRAVSSLLLLRNTRRTRAIVAEHGQLMGAAYPAPAAAAHAALTTASSWPGNAILWADIDRGRTRIRPTPPRGITIGR